MDVNAKEMTIAQILHDWFRYEPKEETRAAKRKFLDEKKGYMQSWLTGLKVAS